MNRVAEHAPAKLNLHLHVTGRRVDGYHLLDSLVVFAELGDDLEATEADELTLVVSGPFAAALAGTGRDNLVLRAAAALRARYGIERGAHLELCKNLPVASGIGGGSADAAATLRALRRLWNIEDPLDPALALGLGADVPVCLGSAAGRMGGIGDVLEPAPVLPQGLFLALANSGAAVSTQAVFRARAGEFRPAARLPTHWPDARTMARDLLALANDLEAPAIALQPLIGDVLAALRTAPGGLRGRLWGAGATGGGLCGPGEPGAVAASSCRARGWWSWSGKTCRAAAIV